MKELAEVFKAAADETRLMILALLAQQGECCVCDVMEVCEITQSKASRHLRTLKHAGLVDDRRVGTWVYYRVDMDKMPAARDFWRANRALLEGLMAKEIANRMRKWNTRKKSQSACSATRSS